jgi:hypothetical protein
MKLLGIRQSDGTIVVESKGDGLHKGDQPIPYGKAVLADTENLAYKRAQHSVREYRSVLDNGKTMGVAEYYASLPPEDDPIRAVYLATWQPVFEITEAVLPVEVDVIDMPDSPTADIRPLWIERGMECGRLYELNANPHVLLAEVAQELHVRPIDADTGYQQTPAWTYSPRARGGDIQYATAFGGYPFTNLTVNAVRRVGPLDACLKTREAFKDQIRAALKRCIAELKPWDQATMKQVLAFTDDVTATLQTHPKGTSTDVSARRKLIDNAKKLKEQIIG